MDATVKTMEAQLRRWAARIDNLTAKTQRTGVEARFNSLIYIDELKVLHALAQSKLEEFWAARDPDRERLKTEMNNAWKELESALRDPRRSARTLKT